MTEMSLSTTEMGFDDSIFEIVSTAERLDQPPEAEARPLEPRHLPIARMMALGMSNAEIIRQTNRSPTELKRLQANPVFQREVQAYADLGDVEFCHTQALAKSLVHKALIKLDEKLDNDEVPPKELVQIQKDIAPRVVKTMQDPALRVEHKHSLDEIAMAEMRKRIDEEQGIIQVEAKDVEDGTS